MIEQIKRGREDGELGGWQCKENAFRADVVSEAGMTIAETWPHIARRIARVPELEEYVLEAHELLKEVLAGACVNYAYIAPRNIERIKKLVGES